MRQTEQEKLKQNPFYCLGLHLQKTQGVLEGQAKKKNKNQKKGKKEK